MRRRRSVQIGWEGCRLAGVLATLTLAGCILPQFPRGTGEEIKPSEVTRVRAGETTKMELFEAFGLPAAIVRPESRLVELPSSAMVMPMASGAIANRAGGTYTLDTAVLCEALEIRQIAANQRIYVFRHSWFSGITFVGLGYLEFAEIDNDELVALVNEETETVEKFYYFDD